MPSLTSGFNGMSGPGQGWELEPMTPGPTSPKRDPFNPDTPPDGWTNGGRIGSGSGGSKKPCPWGSNPL